MTCATRLRNKETQYVQGSICSWMAYFLLNICYSGFSSLYRTVRLGRMNACWQLQLSLDQTSVSSRTWKGFTTMEVRGGHSFPAAVVFHSDAYLVVWSFTVSSLQALLRGIRSDTPSIHMYIVGVRSLGYAHQNSGRRGVGFPTKNMLVIRCVCLSCGGVGHSMDRGRIW